MKLSVVFVNTKSNTQPKMQYFYPIAALAAWLIASCMGGEVAERATYDCPELAKDFYGSDIACGYGLASDWKTCGKSFKERIRGVPN